MSDKILRIKLEVDTGQAAKISEIVNKAISESNQQIVKSKEVLSLEEKVNASRNDAYKALAALTEQANKYNNLLSQGGTSAYLANTQAIKGLDSYNSKLIETQNNLKNLLKLQSQNISSGYSFASANPVKSSSSNAATLAIPDGIRTRNPLTGALIQQEAKATQTLDVATKALNQSLKSSNDIIDTNIDKHRSLITRIVEGVSIYRVYNSILNTVINSIKAIPDIGIQLEATKSILAATVGSEVSVASVLASLNKEAERTGIAVSVLRESFRTFNASALLAGESTETAYRIFTNLNTTITSLHLSADLAQHTFLAFSQILNKGKVQSEELVKQLGNLLPGAFATMAKALGISTQELSKQMKKGLVTAHDSLDAFAQEYAKQFSQSFVIAQQGLNANIGRLQTSFTLLGEAIYAQTSGAMVTFVKGLAAITNEFTAVVNGTSKWTTELNLLKSAIEVAFFIALSNSIAGIGIKFATIAGETALLTTSITKLKLAFSFLSVPTAIVAGILLIANQLKEAIIPAETLIDKLRNQRKEAEDLARSNAQRAGLTGSAQIKFDVENSAEVKTKFNEIKSLAEELEATKQRLNNSKFNPFASINDIQKDKEFIRQGTEELKLQLQEFEKLKAEKKLQLQADAIAAKAKEKDFDTASLEQAKTINFNKETALNDKRKKDLEEQLKYQIDLLEVQKKSLELKAKTALEEGKPIAQPILNKQLNDIQQKELDLKINYQKQFEQIAIDSQNRISNLTLKNTKITLDSALAAIQEIESTGKPDAVSRTGAIGLRQVQPSTLANPGLGLKGIDVPKEILNAETASKAGIATDAQKAALKKYALDNVEVLADFGIRYYKALVDRYKGDFIRAAAAYNAGAGKEDKNIRPPETKNYVNQFIAKTSGEQAEGALLAKQTEQQAAADAQRLLVQDKYLAQQEQQLQKAILIKQVKEEENKLGIELLQAGDQTKEAELAKIKVEFAEKYAKAEELGSEFLRRRLPILEQARIKEVELKDLQNKYNTNERQFQSEVQELTNKSLVGRLKNYNAALALVSLQSKYIEDQRLILEQELKVAQTEEQRLSINQQLAALKQKQVETASFNKTFAASPERQQFDSNEAAIQGSKTASLDLAKQDYEKALQEKSLTAFSDYQQRKSDIEAEFTQASLLNNAKLYEGIFGVASDSFGGITSVMVKMYGKQSEQAKIAFAAQKAFSAGQAIMNTYEGATKAYSQGGIYGAALAAIVVAAGLANVASILAQPVPAAHGGLDNVPAEQTYLLNKGERVLSPRQNVDITNKVTNINEKVNKSTPASSPNIRIINVADENLVYNALGSDQAEKIIMNVVNKNR
jgi:tape measure domain-containing protein